jgi:phosphatidylglycerol---prolipoprotein diacylglyceryl transferase
MQSIDWRCTIGLAMVPYFELKTLTLGPLQLPVFGSLLVSAIIIARWRLLRMERAEGLSAERSMAVLCLVMLIGGLFFAHLAKIALDDFSMLLARPAVVLRTTKGIRSVGGLFGGLLAGIVWCRLRGVTGAETLRMLDRITFVLPVSWMIGRLGCALIHDHIGQSSTSWMAVAFPDGSAYDLGLIEFVFLIPLSLLFWMLGRQPRPAGFFFGLFGVLYGGFRAWLDTLQKHPFGWTFVACLIGQATGLAGWIAMWHYQRRSSEKDALVNLRLNQPS